MDTSSIIGTAINLIIGASFGAVVMFYSYQDKFKRYQQHSASKRINMLEQVAQHVGKVSHVFGKYSSLITEIGPQSDRMSVNQDRELNELSNELVSVYEEISIAESKLLLLGEKRLEKAMKIYTHKMAQYRRQIFPGRYNNIDESKQLKKELSQLRDQFYDILSERYDCNNAA